jgi:hypothetical protein
LRVVTAAVAHLEHVGALVAVQLAHLTDHNQRHHLEDVR